MVNSIGKTTGVNIIRRSDYSKTDSDSVKEVDIANKDSALNNNIFKDIITIQEKKKKKEQSSEDKKNEQEIEKEPDSTDSNNITRKITDFYI